jgi:cathepsin L
MSRNQALLPIIAITAVALAAGAFVSMKPQNTIPEHVQVAFRQWSMRHNKGLYASPEENNFRLRAFYKNYLRVNELNSQNTGAKFTLNKFADMTFEEFEIKMTGFRFTTRPRNYGKFDTLTQAASVDWRTKGAVNPVKNQGQCGSCWAFSAISSLESRNQIATGTLLSLSEQELVDCSGSYGNMGCRGGLMDNAFKYIRASGIAAENDYTYTARDGNCKAASIARALSTISGYTDVPQNNCDALATAVTQGPVSVAVMANNAWMTYTSGIMMSSQCGTSLNHGVTAVGYTSDAWIVRNSWGSSWGENGYIRLQKQGNISTCGVCNMASVPIV